MSEMSGINSTSENTQTVGLQEQNEGIVNKDNLDYINLMNEVMQDFDAFSEEGSSSEGGQSHGNGSAVLAGVTQS